MNIKIDDVNNIVLSHFHLNDSDYLLYTIDDGIPEIYLSKVSYLPKKIHLEKIERKNSQNLKKLMNIFLGKDKEFSFLKEIGYYPLSLDQLKVNKVYKKGSQTLLLTSKQYNLVCQNTKLNFHKKQPSLAWALFLFLILLCLMFLYVIFPF